MGEFRHGVHAIEQGTAILPASQNAGAIPTIFGTAPIHMTTYGAEHTNKPVLCMDFKDAQSQLGYHDDWKLFTLCEAMDAFFRQYQQGPVVFVNVLGEDHKEDIANEEAILAAGKTYLKNGILTETLKVELEAGGECNLNQDYTLTYSQDGRLLLKRAPNGKILSDTTKLSLTYSFFDATKVDQYDIIGGIDPNDGKLEGLELIEEVFPRYRKIPGVLLAPRWTHYPEVTAVLVGKNANINGVFGATDVWVDVPTDTVMKYQDVPEWKNKNNYVDPILRVCWPMQKLGEKIYHASTLWAAATMALDYQNEGIPYQSPSNKRLQTNGAVLEDGKEVFLSKKTAEYLNSQGICTSLNFIGGWKTWGNRSGCFPDVTDPKDTFICVKRMIRYVGNLQILTFWQKVDDPMNKRLVQTIVDSMNLLFNGWESRGWILGGRCELLKEENPITDLMDGIIRFHNSIGFVTPAENITHINEFDPSYLERLFE